MVPLVGGHHKDRPAARRSRRTPHGVTADWGGRSDPGLISSQIAKITHLAREDREPGLGRESHGLSHPPPEAQEARVSNARHFQEETARVLGGTPAGPVRA